MEKNVIGYEIMNEKNHEETLDVMKFLGILLDHKGWIALFTLLTTLIGAGYAFLAPPVYLANASIQIEDKSAGGALKDFAGIFEEKSSSHTEIAILKSRMVLSYAVEKLDLTTQVEPIYPIPILGKLFASATGYSPQITISHFTPLNEAANTLILEIGEQRDSYTLFLEKTTEPLLTGKVGEKYDTDLIQFSLSQINAKPKQRFLINKLPELTVISALQEQLSVHEIGKQTGIINIAIQGKDKKHIQDIVSSIAESYLLQNVARNSAEASKSLEFLNQQLPDVRQKLSDSENRLNEFRLKNESVDLSLEAKATLDTIIQIEADLSELSIQESEISRKFTLKHPSYVALIDKRNVLNAEKERLNKQLEKLPNTQKEMIRFTRDLEVNQHIYIQLLNKMQELDVVKASTIGNVRILDHAQVFPNPVAPKKALVIILAFLLGGLLSSFLVLFRNYFQRGIESTADVDKTGLPTYAAIPHSEQQPAISRKHVHKGKYRLLSESHPEDNAIEAIRSLRTSLHFAMLEAPNNLVMISGTLPSVGKSFISSNLANVLAKTGKRVLLIDADLRRSYLRPFLGIANKQGLSEAIAQNIPFEDIVHQYAEFAIITKGNTPPNPSELFYTARFQQLLEWASSHYDLVVIDTPPILPVTDAAIIGRYVGTTLLVGLFGKTTVKEIEIAKTRFAQAGVPVKGFILNGTKRKALSYYDYYSYRS